MRTIVTILLLALTLNIVTGKHLRRNQAIQASGSGSGSASGSGSGSASGSGSGSASGHASGGVSLNVGGNLSGGASAGASGAGNAAASTASNASGNASGHASGNTSASGSGSANASGNTSGHASGGGHVSASVTLPSVNISGHLGIGGSGSASAGGNASGSASGNTAAAATVTGTCPQAVNMGLTTDDPNKTKGAGGCKYLAHSCCSTDSMNRVSNDWKKLMSRLGHRIWSSARISTAAAVLMGNLNETAKACKHEEKSAAAAAQKKRRIRILQAIQGGASTGGSAGVSAGGSLSGGISANVSGGASGSSSGSAGANASGSSSGSSSGSTGAHASGSGSLHIGGKITTGGSTSASTKGNASGSTSTKGNASGSASTGGQAKGGASTGGQAKGNASAGGSAKAGIHISISAGSSSSSKSSVTLPNDWNVDTNCRANFVTAFNDVQTQASQRNALNTAARDCMTNLFKLRAAMTCSSCDPANESKLSGDFNIVEGTLLNNFMSTCANYLNSWEAYRNTVNLVLAYANDVATSKDITAQQSALSKLTNSVSVSGCFSAAPAPAAGKETKTETKTEEKQPAAAATETKTEKKRRLQAPVKQPETKPAEKPAETKPAETKPAETKPAEKPAEKPATTSAQVTNNSWTWWVKQNVALTAQAQHSSQCLQSAGIQALISNWVFNNNDAQWDAFNPMYRALEVAFAALGNKTGQAKWTAFKGSDLYGSASSGSSSGPIMENGFLPPLKTLNVLASAFAPKDQRKKVATAGRRLQAVEKKEEPKKEEPKKEEPKKTVTGKATITISAQGVAVDNSQNSFAVVSDNEYHGGDGQAELSGNLLKAFTTFALAMLLLLN